MFPDTCFHASSREKYDGTPSFSLLLLDKKLTAINVFLKIGHFLFKANSILTKYYIHFKSQHTVVRAINGLSVAFFNFP